MCIYLLPARATHDARCFSIGFCLAGKVNGQTSLREYAHFGSGA